jgi:fatty-acyl-CoA synthase
MSLDPRTDTVDGVLRRSAAKFPDRTALLFEELRGRTANSTTR